MRRNKKEAIFDEVMKPFHGALVKYINYISLRNL